LRVLVAEAGGQLGKALIASAPLSVTAAGYNSSAFDITSAEGVAKAISIFEPDVIINAAAYTAVDKAEFDEQSAYAVNAFALKHLSDAAALCAARLVHISTDSVCDGRSSKPYEPSDPLNPINVCGRSKLAGEMAAGATASVVRTAWVYGPTGSNFVLTMLRLMASRPEVRIVADQIGTPTSTVSLATAVWALTIRRPHGIWHYTDAGVASWYDFAIAIQEEALELGLLQQKIPIIPISTAQIATPWPRPSFSVLDKSATWTALVARHRTGE
jgi:dTDP-4-dehydrorhamnose reductase